jgi:hypothetical protein
LDETTTILYTAILNTADVGDVADNPTSNPEETILVTKQNRVADTLQTINTLEKEIKLKLFDNGIIDGDSMSIIYNNVPIAININVTGKAFESEILLDNKTSNHTITIVAHNLGTIPSNTATVIIEAGEKTYRISASSDCKKNTVIVIKNE